MSVPLLSEAFDTEGFTQAVRDYLQRHDMSVRLLSTISGLDHTTISQTVLKGDRRPSLYVAARLAGVCDISLDRYVKDPLN